MLFAECRTVSFFLLTYYKTKNKTSFTKTKTKTILKVHGQPDTKNKRGKHELENKKREQVLQNGEHLLLCPHTYCCIQVVFMTVQLTIIVNINVSKVVYVLTSC